MGDNKTSFPALDLSKEEYDRVEEVSIDEWVDRFNDLASKHGGMIMKHGNIIVNAVRVEKVDEVRDTIEQICITSYDDENFMPEDVRQYIDRHDIMMVRGCFSMARKRRARGFVFTLDDGRVIDELYKDRFTRWHKMMIFPNNPTRLAWGYKDIIIPHAWSKDFSAKNDGVFCMTLMRRLTPEDIAEHKRRGACDKCKASVRKKCEKFFK